MTLGNSWDMQLLCCRKPQYVREPEMFSLVNLESWISNRYKSWNDRIQTSSRYSRHLQVTALRSCGVQKCHPDEHTQQTQPGVSPAQSKRWMRCSGTIRTPGGAETAARTQHEDSRHRHSFLSYLHEGLKLFRSCEIQNLQSVLSDQKQLQHFWYRPEEQIAWNLDFAHYPQYSPWSDPDLLRIIINEHRLLIILFFFL